MLWLHKIKKRLMLLNLAFQIKRKYIHVRSLYIDDTNFNILIYLCIRTNDLFYSPQ